MGSISCDFNGHSSPSRSCVLPRRGRSPVLAHRTSAGKMSGNGTFNGNETTAGTQGRKQLTYDLTGPHRTPVSDFQALIRSGRPLERGEGQGCSVARWSSRSCTKALLSDRRRSDITQQVASCCQRPRGPNPFFRSDKGNEGAAGNQHDPGMGLSD